jgi:hypothetical protein
MDPAFKRIAAAEIDEFKAEYRARFPAARSTRSPTRTSCGR